MGTHATAGAATSKAIAARVPRRRRAEEMSPYIIVAQSSGASLTSVKLFLGPMARSVMRPRFSVQ